MAAKFRDVKHTAAFDDQAPVQEAMDKLEKMRTELLSAMFGKEGEQMSRARLGLAACASCAVACSPALQADASAIP